MASYDGTLGLAREGKTLAIATLRECYQWVLKHGSDQDFAAR